MENYLSEHTRAQEILEKEMEEVKTQLEQKYINQITALEEKLQNLDPVAEQKELLAQIYEQLSNIENSLEQKTKNLEILYQLSNNSNSNSQSATEDLSAQDVKQRNNLANIPTPQTIENSEKAPSININCQSVSEMVQRILDKWTKHSRIEEGFVKRINDMEMYLNQMKADCSVSEDLHQSFNYLSRISLMTGIS